MNLGLVFKEAHHPWSRDRYAYSVVELLEHFVKFCLHHTKNKNLPKEAPMEHPCLPEFSTLGTLTGDIDEYELEQEKKRKPTKIKSIGRKIKRGFNGEMGQG